MISGTGLPSAGLSSLTNLLTGNTGRGLFGLPARSGAQSAGGTANDPGDVIQLTDAGRSALQTIQEGLTDLQRQETEFAFARLRELQERIKLTRNLLNNARPEQAGLIYGQLEEIAGGLSKIGNQIGHILSAGRQATSAQTVQGTISDSFNAAAKNAEGISVSYAEELNVEFSFLRISQTEQSVEIKQTEEGTVIETSSRQTELVVAQVNIEHETSLTIQSGSTVDLQGLIDEFRNTVRQLASLLGVTHNYFEQKPIIPQPLLDAIRQLLGAQSEGGKEPLLVNQEA